MSFLLVGLGPRPPGSIQLEALEALKGADLVYLETYTNLGYSIKSFSEFLGRPVIPAPRTTVESDTLLAQASLQTVALCVIGDIFTATTHSTIYLECMERNIPYRLFPNAGIMNTIALAGLELYQYGETVSVPYPLESFVPTRYIDKIQANHERGLHTLCLLDIKADEGRYMTIPEALNLIAPHFDVRLAIGVARLMAPDMLIKAGTPFELSTTEWGLQPHALIIPGKLNAVEEEFIARWKKV